MDLDFEFEDKLLEYTTFQANPAYTSEDYIISQYLIEKIQKYQFISEKKYFTFNPQYFNTTNIVQTLSQFLGQNHSEPIEDIYEGSITTGMLRDSTCHCYDNDSEYPTTTTNSLHVIVTSKFNEIHAIGSDFNLFVARPKELVVDEMTWTESQKFAQQLDKWI